MFRLAAEAQKGQLQETNLGMAMEIAYKDIKANQEQINLIRTMLGKEPVTLNIDDSREKYFKALGIAQDMLNRLGE